MAGLSTKSIFISLISQAIIFLYLLDNDASKLILFSSGLGLAIGAWKVTKAGKLSISWRGLLPRVNFQYKEDYKSTTQEYDDMAFKYLSIALIPCFAGYAIYSLLYQEHKGWYSYMVNMLAGGVYTFGFIMMTPQLFINYKLKSVAHMPWRMMSYKFLNTIIDDLFAFIIKMPTMHRLACFRDDIVFLVFLYQRWCYAVDTSRTNEFEPPAEVVAALEATTEDNQGDMTAATKVTEASQGESTVESELADAASTTMPAVSQNSTVANSAGKGGLRQRQGAAVTHAAN